MRDELVRLSKARLADLVVELWDRNARMRGRVLKQQQVIDRLVEKVKELEGKEEESREDAKALRGTKKNC